MLFCRLLIFFKINFLKKFFHEIPSEYQTVRTLVGPDLGQNCLPKLSADYTGRQRVKGLIISKALNLYENKNGNFAKETDTSGYIVE